MCHQIVNFMNLFAHQIDLGDSFFLGASMEDASHLMVNRTAASVLKVTVGLCVTSRWSCSIHAAACPANMVSARSQTREMPIVTVKVDTLGISVMQVGSTKMRSNQKM